MHNQKFQHRQQIESGMDLLRDANLNNEKNVTKTNDQIHTMVFPTNVHPCPQRPLGGFCEDMM
jgi:hypothetical protein